MCTTQALSVARHVNNVVLIMEASKIANLIFGLVSDCFVLLPQAINQALMEDPVRTYIAIFGPKYKRLDDKELRYSDGLVITLHGEHRQVQRVSDVISVLVILIKLRPTQQRGRVY